MSSVPRIRHSEHVVGQFNARGWPAVHIDGESCSEVRDKATADFIAGRIKILSNVDLPSGEGYDVPSIESIILLRPTMSLGLFLQQCGRGLRPAPGKQEAIILDHVGNTERHGLPDEERSWSLEGAIQRKRKKDGGSTSVRVCPKCFAAQIAGTQSCKFCGFVFEVQARKVEEVDGELSEVDIERLRREKARVQGQAESLEELTAIGVSRKYKFPRRWAYYVFKSRQAKKLGRV